MTFCLLYVSECAVPATEVDSAIADIVAVSRSRNASLGVTGALLFSGSHFAQFVEGDEPDVRSLMASIARDPRHRNLTTLLQEAQPARQFSSWSLAYSGPSNYVQRQLDRLLAPRHSPDLDLAIRDAISIMRRFAED